MTITPQHVDKSSENTEELYGFRDRVSGMWLRFYNPARRYDLWQEYVAGALRTYRKYRVEQALRIPDTVAESMAPIFAVATDDDGVVRAGWYVNGPLTTVHHAYTPGELAAEPVSAALATEWIAQAMTAGVIEIKAVWVDPSTDHKSALADLMARSFAHAVRFLEVRYAYCSAAEHAAFRWYSAGARELPGIVPVAYPDDRYRTAMLWWNAETLLELSTAEQRQLFIEECGHATGLGRAGGPVRGSDAGQVAWRPVHVREPDALTALFDDPSVEVVDTIDRQRRELARTLPEPQSGHLFETTRWYYYPWRRQIVHLLGPQGFQSLRTDRNRNKLTAIQQQQLRQLTVGVVGLSVGHAIAHTLALEGICGQIRLADFDEIELSNLNRIPGTVFDQGVNKAVVVARRIAELDPYIDVRIDAAGVTPESVDGFVDGLDVVIEECDSFDVKLAVRAAARRHRVPLIMETSDRGLLDIERYDVEPHRPLFHGLLGDVDPTKLMGLSTHDKVPYVLRVLEPDELSAKMAASMAEVDETLSTWPQLGGDISLGAATVAAAVRRLGLGHDLPSGRVRVDVESRLADIAEPPVDDLPLDHDMVVDPEPPPATATAAVVHAARLAPSGGNTQPWHFYVTGTGLEIELDPEQTSTLDLAFRGSYIAIGAALFNARVSAARHGVLGHAEVFPHGAPTVPAARLFFGGDDDPELAGLYEAMLRRVSNRHVTTPVPLPDGVIPALRHAVDSEGAEVVFVTDRTRLFEVAEVLGESDRVRFLTTHLHREMMHELRWPGTDSLEWGLDVRTLELDASDLAKLRVARRADVMSVLADQDLGRALGDSTRERIHGTSALAVVTTLGSDPAAYVRSGQAVERLWVEATRLGLAVQAISPVFIYAQSDTDYEELSPRFAGRLQGLRQDFGLVTGIGDRNIAIVIRIGYAPSISVRSRRLPADRTVRTR